MSIDRLEINRKRRGHKFFGSELETTPALYETEEVAISDKIVTAHFFFARGDWYVTEFDASTGRIFGYFFMDGSTYNAEWGYADLVSLEAEIINGSGLPVVIERDLDWSPTRFGDIPFPE